MLDRLNSVSVASQLPYFVTMTLPDEVFDDNCTTFAKSAKSWLDAWVKRLVRVCPTAAGFWRIEWQTRKSGPYEGKLVPHFHLLVWGLPERVLGERDVYDDGQYCGSVEVREAFVDCVDHKRAFEMVDILTSRPVEEGWQKKIATQHRGKNIEFGGSVKYCNRVERLLTDVWMADFLSEKCKSLDRARYMSFADWSALSWYHVVDSHNVDHLTAGVRVERVKSWGGVMSYCAKYMAKADCGFLYEVPIGRSWGIFNRKDVPWAKMVEMDLDQETGVLLRRIARRYLERRFGRRVKSPYGITLYGDMQNFRRVWERPPPDPF
jgi:hypothetical protein